MCTSGHVKKADLEMWPMAFIGLGGIENQYLLNEDVRSNASSVNSSRRAVRPRGLGLSGRDVNCKDHSSMNSAFLTQGAGAKEGGGRSTHLRERYSGFIGSLYKLFEAHYNKKSIGYYWNHSFRVNNH